MAPLTRSTSQWLLEAYKAAQEAASSQNNPTHETQAADETANNNKTENLSDHQSDSTSTLTELSDISTITNFTMSHQSATASPAADSRSPTSDAGTNTYSFSGQPDSLDKIMADLESIWNRALVVMDGSIKKKEFALHTKLSLLGNDAEDAKDLAEADPELVARNPRVLPMHLKPQSMRLADGYQRGDEQHLTQTVNGEEWPGLRYPRGPVLYRADANSGLDVIEKRKEEQDKKNQQKK